MAEEAHEGYIYKIDLHDGKPAHYWIVLNEPRAIDGSFLVVSLTDRHNLDQVSDVWEYNYRLCESLKLSKPSIVALRYASIKNQSWLDHHDAELLGGCTVEALKRARCNLFWYPQFVKTDIKKYANFYAASWTPCGSTPPHPTQK